MRRAALLLVMLALFVPGLVAAESSAAPKLRVRLAQTVAVPGQILELDVSVLVSTWMPKPPQFPTFELPNVSVRLEEGSSRPASERIGRETWSGVTRTYQLSPLVVGRFQIPTQTVRVTYADPETREPIVVDLQMKKLAFEGRAPAGAEDLDPFIAARSLTLEQSIEGDPEDLEPGGAFTRVVTAEVTGASSIFLPPLIPLLEVAGISAYPKEPVFREKSDRGRTTGERIERVTYVAEAGGRFSAEAVRLRWWNLRTKEIEVAEIPAVEIVSRGPPPTAPSAVESEDFAPLIGAGMFFVVILGASLRWAWPRLAEAQRRRREVRLASESYAFTQVDRAMRAQRFGDAVRCLERWSGRLSSSGEFGRASIFEPLEPLSAALYGRSGRAPTRGEWSRALKALRQMRRRLLARERGRSTAAILPVLNPESKISSTR